ncbi:MAG: hypothetical protein ABFD52_07840 [Acidobacteriota bacterium]
MTKLDRWTVQQMCEMDLRNFIAKRARCGFDAPLVEEVLARVYASLERVGEIRADRGEKSVRSFCRLVALRRLYDYWRREASRRRRLDRVTRNDMMRKRITDPTRLAIMAEDAGVEVMHSDLMRAHLAGASRREMAERFGLTENQVRGRLGYSRRKIRSDLARKIRLKEFRGDAP